MKNIEEKPYLFVQRVDGLYDYKSEFESYTEAKEYANECSRKWMRYWDVVYLRVPVMHDSFVFYKNINLSGLMEEDRKKVLKEYNIKY